jgi:hypothetical protein
MASTARPIMLASKTRHPNCSRMGIRILTIARHTSPLVRVSFGGRRRAGSGGPERRGCQSAQATGELRLRDVGVDGVGGQMSGCVRPIPRCEWCEWCERLLVDGDAGRFSRCDDRRSETRLRGRCGEEAGVVNEALLGPEGGDSLGQQTRVAQQTEARMRVKEGTSRRSWGGGGGRRGAQDPSRRGSQ